MCLLLIDCLEHVGSRNLPQVGTGRLPCPACPHSHISLLYPISSLLVRPGKVRSGAVTRLVVAGDARLVRFEIGGLGKSQ
jgi:hypothetical protein